MTLIFRITYLCICVCRLWTVLLFNLLFSVLDVGRMLDAECAWIVDEEVKGEVKVLDKKTKKKRKEESETTGHLV